MGAVNWTWVLWKISESSLTDKFSLQPLTTFHVCNLANRLFVRSTLYPLPDLSSLPFESCVVEHKEMISLQLFLKCINFTKSVLSKFFLYLASYWQYWHHHSHSLQMLSHLEWQTQSLRISSQGHRGWLLLWPGLFQLPYVLNFALGIIPKVPGVKI